MRYVVFTSRTATEWYNCHYEVETVRLWRETLIVYKVKLQYFCDSAVSVN
jgi:hypothetical protein